MKKLNMKSVNLTQTNIDKIAALFPNVITETRDENGNLKKAIDFDLLKQELSEELVEGEKERYQLTWPGKKQAILNANMPIDKTLRPDKVDSVDWDNTQNLYIEGDNLEVLKLLQESYLNKIKCIYIDPPYNTGKDFIYSDSSTEPTDEYLQGSGQIDESGNRYFVNTETNGRFHSNWLTDVYGKIKIARKLLSEKGVIFISIDDREVSNLHKICDEIFGAANFIAKFIWKKRKGGGNDSHFVAVDHEYILVYAKNKAAQDSKWRVKYEEEYLSRYKEKDEHGRFYWDTLSRPGLQNPITFTYKCPDGSDLTIYSQISEETFYEGLKSGTIRVVKSKGKWTVHHKVYMPSEGKVLRSILDAFGDNNEAGKELESLFGSKVFDYPKPPSLIKKLVELVTNKTDIVMDFYSGAATTAHAVLQLNAEDLGKRRFIMVQISELISDDSEASKLGYKTICEIGKERIRRAAKKIKEETGADIDYGFRVFRVDSSNMKDVYYTPDKLIQGDIYDMKSNIKEDRTGEDLLIQVMLELGLELSLPMKTKEIEGKTVHYVAENSLIACFDEVVTESVIREIAKDQPLRAVFRDSSFADDSARINVEELFKMLSPGTDVRVM